MKLKLISVFFICLVITGLVVFTYTIPTVKALDTLIDSQNTRDYDESLKRPWGSTGAYSGNGQTFISPSESYILTSATFKLSKTANPTGYLYFELYEVTGSVGSNAVPIGSSLSVSSEISISSLPTSPTDYNIGFNSSQQYIMLANHNYAICVHIKVGSVNNVNYVNVGANSTNSHYGNIVRYNSVLWGAVSTVDMYFKIYGVLSESLIPSNEGYINNENGIESTFSSYWVGSNIYCSGYIFSLNYGVGYVNDTWVAFSANNNTWANITKTLLGSSSQLGNTISYVTYANSSSNSWFVSAIKTFVLQATVSFNFNSSRGIIERNHTLINDGAVTVYTTPTNLTLGAFCNSNFGWLSWNYTNSLGSSTNNPFTYQVVNKTDIWCIFSEIGTQEPPFNFQGNATVNDVFNGYSFYSSNSTLRVGIYISPTNSPIPETTDFSDGLIIGIIVAIAIGLLLGIALWSTKK